MHSHTILLCGFFLSILCMLPITVNTKPVSQSIVSGEDGKVTAWTAINLCVWNPITASSFGAHINTSTCEDELLPFSCLQSVLYTWEQAFNLWARHTGCSSIFRLVQLDMWKIKNFTKVVKTERGVIFVISRSTSTDVTCSYGGFSCVISTYE